MYFLPLFLVGLFNGGRTLALSKFVVVTIRLFAQSLRYGAFYHAIYYWNIWLARFYDCLPRCGNIHYYDEHFHFSLQWLSTKPEQTFQFCFVMVWCFFPLHQHIIETWFDSDHEYFTFLRICVAISLAKVHNYTHLFDCWLLIDSIEINTLYCLLPLLRSNDY